MLIANFGDSKKTLEDQPKIVKTALNLFMGQGKGSDMLTAYNTAYGLLQAVTKYNTHHSKQTATSTSSLVYGTRAASNNKMYESLMAAYGSQSVISGTKPKSQTLTQSVIF